MGRESASEKIKNSKMQVKRSSSSKPVRMEHIKEWSMLPYYKTTSTHLKIRLLEVVLVFSNQENI